MLSRLQIVSKLFLIVEVQQTHIHKVRSAMANYQLSLLLRVVVVFLLLGQISLVQCADQSVLQLPERSKPPRHAGSWHPPKPIGIDFGPEYVYEYLKIIIASSTNTLQRRSICSFAHQCHYPRHD